MRYPAVQFQSTDADLMNSKFQDNASTTISYSASFN
jgi:hypothetical protein